MGIIDSAKAFFQPAPKTDKADDTKYTKIETLEQAANYLQAIKDQTARGDHKIDVEVTTASSPERRMFLNYAISLIHDKFMKYKILLFLRVNPYYENAATGTEAYLSKKEIANALSKRVGRRILETEIDGEEQKAIRIAMDAVASCRLKHIPFVGGIN